MEIVYFRRTGGFSSRLDIFESAGDNTYNLVYSLPTHEARDPIIGDFDGDGLIEIADCGYSTPVPQFLPFVPLRDSQGGSGHRGRATINRSARLHSRPPATYIDVYSPELTMIRFSLVATAVASLLACPVPAAELVITPGPTFYTARGLSAVFAAPLLFCTDQFADPMRSFYIVFSTPDSFEPYPSCWMPSMRANMVLEREETATLPAIGSTATIRVRLASLRFVDSFMLNSCNVQSNWGVDAQVSQRRISMGTMTIRRESEFGGTFDLQCACYLGYAFQRYINGYPWDRFGKDLGPYVLQATRVGWSTLPGGGITGGVPCPACSGPFFVTATTLSGIGNSEGDERDDSLRLEDSELSLQLTPSCLIPTAVQADSWGGTKALYR